MTQWLLKLCTIRTISVDFAEKISSLYLKVPEPEEEFVTPLRERLGLDQTTRGQSALMIRDAIRADHGNFTIQVENIHGVATATCAVNVLGKIQIDPDSS